MIKYYVLTYLPYLLTSTALFGSFFFHFNWKNCF